MKLIDNLVRKTKIYNDLFLKIAEERMRITNLQDINNKQYEIIVNKNDDIDKLTKEILEKNIVIKANKKYSKQIHKLTQDKNIRKLCNKIIKGEK